MKKVLCAFVLVMIMCAGVMAASNDKVDSGILTYLGTTEGEFQQALDDLRKALTPLITEESAKHEWEDYDLLEGFLSELVRARRVVHFYDSLVAMQMALKANRIDEIVIFNTLSKNAINQILDKIIHEIEYRLKDIDLHIELTDVAREKFIEEGYDIHFGARPLKRLVGRTLEVDLSKLLIEGALKEHDVVIVNYVNDKFVVKKRI